MHSAIITDKEVKKQSVERKIQDKKKMCSARSRKEGKTLLVHESSDYEESEPDEPEKQKKKKEGA